MEEIQSSAAQTERARPADSEHLSLARAFGGPSLLREIVETVLLAMILFAVVNLTTARFRVHGSSMEPTLQEGEYLIVSKVVYQVHPPERGDIIVFRPPSGSEDYIKRIIGLPGDRVEIRDGTVLVNGVALEESYTLSHTPVRGHWAQDNTSYWETTAPTLATRIVGGYYPTRISSARPGCATGHRRNGARWHTTVSQR